MLTAELATATDLTPSLACMSDPFWDVIIVGGGPAGLSAAVVLAQARRAVLVIDAAQQRNLRHSRTRGYLTRDGLPPTELVAIGRAEASSYGATILEDTVTRVSRVADGFHVETKGGARLSAAHLLLATGLRDELPAIPGVAENWGESVFHCPYCGGSEMTQDVVAVLSVGQSSIMEAHLLRQWVDRVILLTNDLTEPTPEQLRLLAACGIELVDHAVTRVTRGPDNRLRLLHTDGSTTVCDRLLVGPQLHIRRDLLDQLGVTIDEKSGPDGVIIPTGDSGGTSEFGVWVAGNVMDTNCQVIEAAAQGLKAAIAINASLVRRELDLLTRQFFDPDSGVAEPEGAEPEGA